MNRWQGTSDDSAKQTSERNRRAASRFIRSLPTIQSDSDTDDAPFQDCNQSLTFNQLDGNEETDDMTDAASILRQEKAKPVELANFPDDDEAWKKEIKVKFNQHDVVYWFNTIESDMKKFGINTQWSKKSAIVGLLPEEVVEELMPLLRLTETEAGDNIYKLVKDEIVSLYGPRDEDAFQKAMSLRLTGKPSALGKKLIHIWCPGPKPFQNCHCAKVVWGFWHSQLTIPIKSALAGQKFNANTYQAIFKQADEVFLANGGAAAAPAVVSAVSQQPSSEDSQSAQVSAVGGRGRGQNRGGFQPRGRGRGNGRGNGGNRGNRNSSGTQQSNTYNNNSQNQNQSQTRPNNSTNPKPHQRGPRHPDGPPDSACSRHWAEGRGATYCSDPLVCEWVKIITPRQKQ